MKYQSYMDFPAHGKNIAALSKMLWLLDSNCSCIYPFTPIVVFEAFTIESYINTLGWEKIKFWDEIERLPWKKKISILHKYADKEADWGKDPLQFAQEVFQIRDKLAHGKPEKVKGELFSTYKEAEDTLGSQEMEPDWFKKINREWIVKSKDRFTLLMEYLSEIANHPKESYKFGADGGVIEIEDA